MSERDKRIESFFGFLVVTGCTVIGFLVFVLMVAYLVDEILKFL